MKLFEVFGFFLVTVCLIMGGYVFADSPPKEEAPQVQDKPENPSGIRGLIEMIIKETGSDNCHVSYKAKRSDVSVAEFDKTVAGSTQYMHMVLHLEAHITCIKKVSVQEQ